jgi:hypothetical protein
MALASYESWSGGFVRITATGTIVVTRSAVGASMQGGFLRDADGRLVVA